MSETSKQAILKKLRANLLEAVALPDLRGPWIRFDDPWERFEQTLQAVGGEAIGVASDDDLNAELEQRAAFSSAKKICSVVPGIDRANIELDTIDDPHALADIDFAVIRGEFAVAENGAIWVTDAGLKHRVLPFITQHLAIVVPRREIVHNMHEAYERLTFADGRFGVFISGPSKTADIEQSLVVGAHGARSLIVLLVGD